MALTMLVPALAFSVYVVLHLAAVQREQFNDRLRQQVANLANDLDRDTERLLTLLDTLALSRDLKAHDFAAFRETATLAVARAGTFIAVSHADGQQLVNTRAPLGTPLPNPPIPDAQRAALAVGNPYIGDLVLGSISHKWVFGISIPLKLDGYPGAMMTMVVDADHLHPILEGQFLPDDWLTDIVDRSGRIVARSHDDARFVGMPVVANRGWMPRPSGEVYETVTLDRVPVLASNAKTKYGGWDVGASVPRSLIDAEIRRTELGLTLVGLGLLALASGLASLLARWIIEPVKTLASAAADLGVAGSVTLQASPVVEVNDVASTLRAAELPAQA